MAWVEFRKGKLINSDKFSYVAVIEETCTDDDDDNGEYYIRFVCDGKKYSTESYSSKEDCEIAFRYLQHALKIGESNIDITSVSQLVNMTSISEERVPMTEEYLLNKGFTKDFDELLEVEEFFSPNKQIMVRHHDTNRLPPYNWYVHVDNQSMDTIGSLDFAYVDEFETFIKLCGVEL